MSYICPMHPEVTQDGPGSCPKCGMFLVPQEEQAPHPNGHGHAAEPAAGAKAVYTCPMHPEVTQDGPGSCPKCGMFLVPQEQDKAATPMDHTAMDHSDMDHGDMDFMSMVDVTQDLPRSPDGLPMDWIEVAFGPCFPALPSGLRLLLTLDGDTVARASAESVVGHAGTLPVAGWEPNRFVAYLGTMDPLAPMAYRLLACRALEAAAGRSPDPGDPILRGGIAVVERERIASHLGWLAQLGEHIGPGWLARRAAVLQHQCLGADWAALAALRPALMALGRRLHRAPLLRSRLAGMGPLPADPELRGPVARAAGVRDDARTTDPAYAPLSFQGAYGREGDALERLRVRLAEIGHSLDLIQQAGALPPPSAPSLPSPATLGSASGEATATVETPRGTARLHLGLDRGRLAHARLDTASTLHLRRLPALLEQQEVGDALTVVGSLDLSPWEVSP